MRYCMTDFALFGRQTLLWVSHVAFQMDFRLMAAGSLAVLAFVHLARLPAGFRPSCGPSPCPGPSPGLTTMTAPYP